MANTLKLQSLAQNTYAGSTTIKSVKHGTPEYSHTQTGLESVSVAHTTADELTVVINSGAIVVEGVSQKNPITGATLAVAGVSGFVVQIERAAASTAPTGTVYLSTQAFAGVADVVLYPMKENSIFQVYNPSPGAYTALETLSVDLGGTTGYRANVLVYFDPA